VKGDLVVREFRITTRKVFRGEWSFMGWIWPRASSIAPAAALQFRKQGMSA
jgi:hypothetical protein